MYPVGCGVTTNNRMALKVCNTSLSTGIATVNREYFVVKIFSDNLACAKIKRTKIHTQY